MRKIKVLSFLSLDGVMQAPGGPDEDTSGGFEYGGWTFPLSDETSGQMMLEQLRGPYDLLLGRKTYEIFAGYWPHHDDNPIGKVFNKTKKYVASRTLKALTHLEWNNSELLKDDIVESIKKLKSEDGPELQVHGSGNFIQTLLKNDLVDELLLKIFPVTLGKGKRLFAEGAMPAAFTLYESKTTPSGVIFANYRRAGEVKTGSF